LYKPSAKDGEDFEQEIMLAPVHAASESEELIKDPDGALFDAALAGDLASASAALLAGASTSYKHPAHGCDALHKASSFGHAQVLHPLSFYQLKSLFTTQVVAKLVESGASTSTKDPDGRAALHQACADGHSEVVRVLVEGGADVGIIDFDSSTPLHFAACAGETSAIHLLLTHGWADIDAQNDTGATAMHMACRQGHPNVVLALLAAGANIHSLNVDQCSPLHRASESGHRNAAAVCSILLKHGADVNGLDCSRASPLHLAVHVGEKSMDVTRLLLQSGSNLSLKNSQFRTPLEVATNEPRRLKCQVELLRSWPGISDPAAPPQVGR
jgi:ankyrin repeat protein